LCRGHGKRAIEDAKSPAKPATAASHQMESPTATVDSRCSAVVRSSVGDRPSTADITTDHRLSNFTCDAPNS
jgi:hypothetical protein